MAIKILGKNCSSIPFEKITSNFDDAHVFNEDVNELYRRLFEQIDVAQRHEMIQKSISTKEVENLLRQKLAETSRHV